MEGFTVSSIVRSRRRTVALVITRDAALVVRAPFRTPVSQIDSFIARKSSWIRRKIAEAAARRAQSLRAFTEGERFLYLGVEYPLALVDGPGPSVTLDGALRVRRSVAPEVRRALVAWYRQEAVTVIRERVELYAAISGLAYGRFTVTDARSRWGSCSAADGVSFSWRLVMAPIDVIDYVVVHELTHIRHKDHSKRFWTAVAAVYPEYEESRAWLKENGHLLTF